MGKRFDNLYAEFQRRIELNRAKFEAHNATHVGQHAAEIFAYYWAMEGSSNSFDGEENEKIKVSVKPTYYKLPGDLQGLVN